MPLFRYEAVDPAGKRISGQMEAVSRAALIERLRTLGHLPIRVAETAAAKAPTRSTWTALQRPIAAKDVTAITRQLAVLLEAGLTLDQAFSLLIRRQRHAFVRAWLAGLQEGVRAGKSLTRALEPHAGLVGSAYLGLVHAGETSGALPEILKRLADYLETSQERRQKLASALVYPVILLVVCVAAIIVMMTVVVPRFAPFLTGAGVQLPWLLSVLMWITDAIGRAPWVPPACLAVFLVAYWTLSRSASFALLRDQLLLSMPFIGTQLAGIQTARLARTLGLMLGHGVQLPDALEVGARSIGNRAFRTALERIRQQVRQGCELGASLAEAGCFPELAVELVGVGERSGRLGAMLVKLADILDRQAEQTLARQTAMLVPLLTILCGGIVAAVVGSLFSALLDVYSVPFGGTVR